MDPQGIEKFNLLNESNKVKPNYDISNKDAYIELYVGKEKLCIIGSVDHIANNKFKVFSQLYKVIDFNDFLKLKIGIIAELHGRQRRECYGPRHLDITMG